MNTPRTRRHRSPNRDCELILYGIVGNTLNPNAELFGSGKKRKKKTYTTPSKIKHKCIQVKLAILEHYKADKSGKATRLRRECLNSTYSAGICMAKHKNWHHCGEYHLTYILQKISCTIMT